MKYFPLFCLAWLLTACKAPEIATPLPTPKAISIFYPASLQPWSKKLAGCAGNIPGIALYFSQTTNPATLIKPDEIILNLGQPPKESTDSYVSQVGWEQVAVIVNQANPVVNLTIAELKQIFTGQLTVWESKLGKTIQVWVLPEGEPSRYVFDNALELSQPLPPDAMLAPDPQAMLEAIKKNEGAIGYLPQSYLSSNGELSESKVKILRLDDSLVQELNQPVLAITQNEPTGEARNLLLCVQDSSAH